MNFTTPENALWAAGFAGNIALLAVLLLKRRARLFPVFTAFIAYQVLETAVLFQISRSHNRHAYFLTYWSFAGGDYVGQIAVIFEMARAVLRPTGTWLQDARRSFLLYSLAGFGIAFAFALAVKSSGNSAIEVWSFRSSLFTSLLTCEVFLAMSSAANRLSLQWRNHVMALGQGLTLWASVALLVDIARVAYSSALNVHALITLRSAAYVAAVAFWTVAFVLPERRRAPLPPEMQQYLATLHERVQNDLRNANSRNGSST